MKQYKDGTKFTVCSEVELIKRGWHLKSGYYYHDDFPSDRGNLGPPISIEMIQKKGGSILTIKEPYKHCKNWYYAEENPFIWPVATFLEETIKMSVVITNHECSEGVTPIDGWFICKTCGQDLRKIR